MDTFTITAYSATGSVATVTFEIADRPDFTGGTFAGIKISGVPKTSVEDVKTYLRLYVDSLIATKQADNITKNPPSAEVAALLNQTTEF